MPIVASVFIAVHLWRIRKDGNISSPMEAEWKAVQVEEIARKKLAARLAKTEAPSKPDSAPATAEKN